MSTFQRKSLFSAMAAVAMILSACDNGSNSAAPVVAPPPPPPPPAAPADPVVYMVMDETLGEIRSLQLVNPLTPGTSVQINSSLVAGGEIGPFSLSPDLTKVAYAAFQDTTTEGELYLVNLATPGTSVKLNGPLTAGGFVDEFVFSPDGNRLAYVADQDVFGQFELYLVNVATPGASTRLNPPLPGIGSVSFGFSFSPDSSSVLYAADLDVPGQFELFLTDITAPGTASKVNGAFAAGGNLASGYGFSPNGETVVYMADQDVDGVRELYAVDVSNPGVSTKLNPPLASDGDICTFEFSPDSTKVAYCADQDVDGVQELYVVDLSAPGISMKVNAALVAGGDVQAGTFRFGPGSDFIVYRADQDVDGVNELYMVDLATPGVSAKINEALPAGGDVSIFQIHPDGLQLVYVADQDTEGLAELYLVDLATPGVSTTLNPVRQGAPIFQIEFTDDGSQLYYHADQDTAGLNELYRVDIANAGVATKINSPLPAGSNLYFFAIAPGFPF